MILLDSHVVAWMVREPRRLSRPARRSIERGRSGGLAMATVSLMEPAHMAAKGSIHIVRTPTDWLASPVADGGLTLKEITSDIAAVAAHLPPSFPADPFDRIIAATAIVERL